MKEIFKTLEKIALLISKEVKYADLTYLDHKNETGDLQLKLDVKSDLIIENEFKKLTSVQALISEEKADKLEVNKEGKYIIAYDPLDGSSLVDVNFAVGSIFAIYEGEVQAENLKAAAYIIYGPRLELVFCESKPQLFRLNEAGDFAFIKDLSLGEKGKINASGGTQKNWSELHRNFIRSLFDEGYRLRYSGAMVSDLHLLLLKGGGIFSYPSTSDAPQGKLRLVFEVLPMAYIFEKAQGKTSNGENSSLLTLKVEKIHQTSPCFFASSYEMEKLREYYGK